MVCCPDGSLHVGQQIRLWMHKTPIGQQHITRRSHGRKLFRCPCAPRTSLHAIVSNQHRRTLTNTGGRTGCRGMFRWSATKILPASCVSALCGGNKRPAPIPRTLTGGGGITAAARFTVDAKQTTAVMAPEKSHSDRMTACRPQFANLWHDRERVAIAGSSTPPRFENHGEISLRLKRGFCSFRPTPTSYSQSSVMWRHGRHTPNIKSASSVATRTASLSRVLNIDIVPMPRVHIHTCTHARRPPSLPRPSVPRCGRRDMPYSPTYVRHLASQCSGKGRAQSAESRKQKAERRTDDVDEKEQ